MAFWNSDRKEDLIRSSLWLVAIVLVVGFCAFVLRGLLPGPDHSDGPSSRRGWTRRELEATSRNTEIILAAFADQDGGCASSESLAGEYGLPREHILDAFGRPMEIACHGPDEAYVRSRGRDGVWETADDAVFSLGARASEERARGPWH